MVMKSSQFFLFDFFNKDHLLKRKALIILVIAAALGTIYTVGSTNLVLASSCTTNYPTNLKFSGGSGSHWASSVLSVIRSSSAGQYDCTNPFSASGDQIVVGVETTTIGNNIVYFNTAGLFFDDPLVRQ